MGGAVDALPVTQMGDEKGLKQRWHIKKVEGCWVVDTLAEQEHCSRKERLRIMPRFLVKSWEDRCGHQLKWGSIMPQVEQTLGWGRDEELSFNSDYEMSTLDIWDTQLNFGNRSSGDRNWSLGQISGIVKKNHETKCDH